MSAVDLWLAVRSGHRLRIVSVAPALGACAVLFGMTVYARRRGAQAPVVDTPAGAPVG